MNSSLKESPGKSLSLIVCTYNRATEVLCLLKSVEQQTRIPDEILIIDASEGDETKTAIENFHSPTLSNRIIYHKAANDQRGLTRQRNFGISKASCDLFAFLDDDVVLGAKYFTKVMKCFESHDEAIGVGGYINSSLQWEKVDPSSPISLTRFRSGSWERREDIRWVIRKLLRLDNPFPPGWISESGHGRTLGSIPPDGLDHEVQILMGGASAWKREVFERISFSNYFEGYGLYEDFDFTIRASKMGKLFLCTKAQLDHYHAPSGRPNHFRYGMMVVRNGWYVWRVQWPNPSTKARFKWWAVTVLLTALRLIDFRPSAIRKAIPEGFGRVWGICSTMLNPPLRVDQQGND